MGKPFVLLVLLPILSCSNISVLWLRFHCISYYWSCRYAVAVQDDAKHEVHIFQVPQFDLALRLSSATSAETAVEEDPEFDLQALRVTKCHLLLFWFYSLMMCLLETT
jgi:hypothetical protein